MVLPLLKELNWVTYKYEEIAATFIYLKILKKIVIARHSWFESQNASIASKCRNIKEFLIFGGIEKGKIYPKIKILIAYTDNLEIIQIKKNKNSSNKPKPYIVTYKTTSNIKTDPAGV